MRINLFIFVFAIAGSNTVFAEEYMMNHQMHRAAMANDTRQSVSFPPMMREHTLSNMRDHLQALSEILVAISEGNYAEAAKIADSRLGMASSAAESCKAEVITATPQMSKAPNMEQQMNQLMPQGMRSIGLEMHQAASVFATEVSQSIKTQEVKPALAALSRVTRQCVACHAQYKLL